MLCRQGREGGLLKLGIKRHVYGVVCWFFRMTPRRVRRPGAPQRNCRAATRNESHCGRVIDADAPPSASVRFLDAHFGGTSACHTPVATLLIVPMARPTNSAGTGRFSVNSSHQPGKNTRCLPLPLCLVDAVFIVFPRQLSGPRVGDQGDDGWQESIAKCNWPRRINPPGAGATANRASTRRMARSRKDGQGRHYSKLGNGSWPFRRRWMRK